MNQLNTSEKMMLTVEAVIEAPVEIVWKTWTTPADIVNWNHASDDWHTTRAENDLRAGGKLISRMEARDGSMGFDFEGTYDQVIPVEYLAYTLADGRKVMVSFIQDQQHTKVKETFEAEGENTPELQRTGWQAILDNFKKYTELSWKQGNHKP